VNEQQGFVVELDRRVRVRDGGRTLVGGAPVRLVRLSERAMSMLDGRRIRVSGPGSARLAARLLALGMAGPVIAELPPVDLSEVTVVTPVRDRPASLDRLLAAIGKQIGVIVVDDCSRDPEATARVAARHGAELVALSRNGGPATARNAGLARVSTPFVAFVDSDAVIRPDAVATLLRHFHHRPVAAVAPQILGLPASGRANWIFRYENARSSLDLGMLPAMVHPRSSAVTWVPGVCLVARVEAIGDGFTAGMRVGEDVDFVWRLVAEGWQVRYEPAATAWHEHRTRPAAWLRRKAFYGTGAHALSVRHGGNVAPVVLPPWSVAVAAALLAQRRWSAPVAATVLAVVSARLARTVSRSDHPGRLAAELTGLGFVATAVQVSALLLRHWWPLSLAGCLVSRRLRRAVLLAGLADGLAEYVRVRPRLDPIRFLIARRLDDFAYGAGVWTGAVRGRSARCLLPDVRASIPGRGGGRRAA
jgi:mycofactocin system glycosyltransferase